MSSGFIDTRLYDKPLFLARILHLLDGKITEEEKEIIKEHFKIKELNNGNS